MNLLKKFAIAATAALPLLLGGCGQPATPLCPSQGDGIGQASYSRIFNDAAAPVQKVCHVRGSDLRQGGRYELDSGLLVVQGDVPARASIAVDSGKAFISGNVGEKARVSAKVPEELDAHTSTVLIPMMVGKAMMLMPMTQTHYTFREFTYGNDKDPAMIVGGDVAANAELTSNHDFHVAGNSSVSAKFVNSQSAYNAHIYNGPAKGFFISPLTAQPS